MKFIKSTLFFFSFMSIATFVVTKTATFAEAEFAKEEREAQKTAERHGPWYMSMDEEDAKTAAAAHILNRVQRYLDKDDSKKLPITSKSLLQGLLPRKPIAGRQIQQIRDIPANIQQMNEISNRFYKAQKSIWKKDFAPPLKEAIEKKAALKDALRKAEEEFELRSQAVEKKIDALRGKLRYWQGPSLYRDSTGKPRRPSKQEIAQREKEIAAYEEPNKPTYEQMVKLRAQIHGIDQERRRDIHQKYYKPISDLDSEICGLRVNWGPTMHRLSNSFAEEFKKYKELDQKVLYGEARRDRMKKYMDMIQSGIWNTQPDLVKNVLYQFDLKDPNVLQEYKKMQEKVYGSWHKDRADEMVSQIKEESSAEKTFYGVSGAVLGAILVGTAAYFGANNVGPYCFRGAVIGGTAGFCTSHFALKQRIKNAEEIAKILKEAHEGNL